jgi:hypothetical protein
VAFVDESHEELVIRAKWSLDGAVTLAEAAEMARELADNLDTLEREGWQLDAPITDDYGFVHRVKRAM